MSSQQSILGFPHLKMEPSIHSVIQLPDAMIFSAGQWIQLNELNHPLSEDEQISCQSNGFGIRHTCVY